MNWMVNLVVAVQILAALVMIGLVLVQHGKGADMGASFGSGASGSLFGATGSANFLSRSTAFCAMLFFACTLLLAYLSNERLMRPADGGSSVLERPAAAASAASAAPLTGAAQIPGAAPAAPAASGAAAIPAPAAPASVAASKPQ
jgi:preprotein translocase subunit SecG